MKNVQNLILIIILLVWGLISYLIYNGQFFSGSAYTCPYEYGECPNKGCANHINTQFGEYQIIVEEQGTLVYDGDRFVGFLSYDSTQAFDKLILKDNL